MQEAASSLDKDRERRLAAIKEAEHAAEEADDQARQRSKKYGGDREFTSNIRRQASDANLSNRFAGGRQRLRKDED